jgi:hypothetical protein
VTWAFVHGTPNGIRTRVATLRDRPGVDVGGLATMDIQGLATGGPASDRQYSVGAARLGAGWARKTMGGRAPARQSTGPRGTVEGAAARLTLSDVMPMPTWPVPATDRWASAPGQESVAAERRGEICTSTSRLRLAGVTPTPAS